MTAGVEGSVDPEEAARDSRRDRRPGVFGDGVPVPAVDQAGAAASRSPARAPRGVHAYSSFTKKELYRTDIYRSTGTHTYML